MIITDKTPAIIDECGNWAFEFPHLGINAPADATPEYIKQLELADEALGIRKMIAHEHWLSGVSEGAREGLMHAFIETIVENPYCRVYKAGDNFIIYETSVGLSWTLEEYFEYIFKEAGWFSYVCMTSGSSELWGSYFSTHTSIVGSRNQ